MRTSCRVEMELEVQVERVRPLVPVLLPSLMVTMTKVMMTMTHGIETVPIGWYTI